MPNRPPVEFSKGRGGGFSINSRLGIRSCNSSLFKWSLSPGHVPFAILAGGEGSGRRSYAEGYLTGKLSNIVRPGDRNWYKLIKGKLDKKELDEMARNVYDTDR